MFFIAHKTPQIPGWNIDPVCVLDESAGFGSVAHDATVEQKQCTGCTTDRNYVDAELHEELIWMEAAITCDGRSQATASQTQATNGPRAAKSDPTDALQNDAMCRGIDDWYCDSIEAEISKLEQQQRSLCEAQTAFESALLQWRPVSEFLP
jgi:hypothetical protein